MIIPPYLREGSTIAITCPAGFMAAEKINICVETLQEQGYNVIVGKTVGGNSTNYFSGTDDERLLDFQSFLDDENVDAILCGRGGYGMGKIIDRIDVSAFLKKPKWIIGFSDITVLHSYLFSNFKMASIHAGMALAFAEYGKDSDIVQSLLKMLKGEKSSYSSKPNEHNKQGKTKGKLVGGNLTLLINGIGTSSDIDTKKCILFIEDLGEQLYHLDRMLSQLKRSGKLKNLAGLIVGGFTDMKDTERPFGKNIYEIILEAVADYDYPVCFDFPVSHGKENVALKHGVKHKFVVSESGTLLQEI